jgi:hypothetical protein
VSFEPPSAAELLSQIASDPDALAVLQRLVGSGTDRTPPAYTVATLAAALDVTERVVRNAIARGELSLDPPFDRGRAVPAARSGGWSSVGGV